MTHSVQTRQWKSVRAAVRRSTRKRAGSRASRTASVPQKQMVQNIILGDLSTQPLLYFPPGFTTQFPDDYEVEFRQTGVKVLELHMVSPKSPAKARRYKIVRHNSGTWTSVPKPWLRDQSARPGDEVAVTWNTTTAILTLKRKVRI